MKRMMNKLLALFAGALLSFPIMSVAQDYFQASGIPVQRSSISSSEFRTEFSNIETLLSDKLPAYTGNGLNFVRVNAGGTALESITPAAALAAIGSPSLSANETVTGQWTFEGRVDIDNGIALRLYDSTDTDFADFSHDGTDFNLAFTTTTDWNVTGITALSAGTVDADFDAITATSYGGITEANLLDKSAVETVSGAWTLTGGATFTTANIVAGTIDADFDAITGTSYGGITEANLVDKAATEAITGTWNFDSPIQIRADIVTATPPTTETPNARVRIFDLDGTDQLGYIGFGGGNSLNLQSNMHGATLQIRGEDSAGVDRIILNSDPDAITELRGDTDVNITVVAGTETAASFRSNADVELRHNNVATARTLTAATGGFEANNTLTGGGFERVLTTGDTASETASGIVERATQAEVDAGIDTTRYVSPATLAAVSGSFSATPTGVTSPTGTISYSIQRNLCTLLVTVLVGGNSNATTFTFSGLPAVATPASQIALISHVADTGITNLFPALATVKTDNTIEFSLGSPFSTTGFTNDSNVKGLPVSWTITYPLS